MLNVWTRCMQRRTTLSAMYGFPTSNDCIQCACSRHTQMDRVITVLKPQRESQKVQPGTK